MRLILLLVFCFAALSPARAPGQATVDEGIQILPSEAKRLVRKAFQGKKKEAAAAREKLLRCRVEDRPAIFDAIESLPRRRLRAPRKKRLVEQIDTPEGSLPKAPCVIRFPSRYDGRKPSPLLFRFHGSGDTAEAFDRNCNEDRAFGPFIQVTPQIPSAERQGWNEKGTRAMVDRIYRKMLAEYCVDTDRVYFSGYSAGGAAAFYYPQGWPHRAAALYSMSRVYWLYRRLPEPCMDILAQVPGFFVVGLDDTPERVEGYRKVEAYYQQKKYPGVFHFVKRKGHTYMREFNKDAAAYLLNCRRQRYPKSLTAVFFEYSNQDASELPLLIRSHWLIAGEFAQGGTPCTVSVDGNVIEIVGPYLRSGSLLLNDHIVNMGESVVVRLNGKAAFNATVERSMSFLLDWYAENGDRGDLYWNKISF